MDYPAGVRPSGENIEIRWQYKGRRYSETIAKKPNKTNIAYAARIRQQRINDAKHGVSTTSRSNPGFQAMAQDFLNTAKIAPSTRESYKNLLELYWSPLAASGVADITYDLVWQIDNSIKWSSAKTRKNAITVLRGVFRLAKRRGFITSNPAAELEQDKHQKPEIQPFTAAEKETILSSLTGQALVYFTLAFETGARTGELLGLTWADYDGDTLLINKSIVRGQLKESTKTSKSRRVLLTERAKKALKSTPSRFKGGYIFVIEKVNGGPYVNSVGQPFKDADNFNRAFKAALNDNGIPVRRAYNCRHTYASLGLTAGAKPGFLASQLGHSLEMFFTRYAKYMESDNDVSEVGKLNKMGIEMGMKSDAKA